MDRRDFIVSTAAAAALSWLPSGASSAEPGLARYEWPGPGDPPRRYALFTHEQGKTIPLVLCDKIELHPVPVNKPQTVVCHLLDLLADDERFHNWNRWQAMDEPQPILARDYRNSRWQLRRDEGRFSISWAEVLVVPSRAERLRQGYQKAFAAADSLTFRIMPPWKVSAELGKPFGESCGFALSHWELPLLAWEQVLVPEDELSGISLSRFQKD